MKKTILTTVAVAFVAVTSACGAQQETVQGAPASPAQTSPTAAPEVTVTVSASTQSKTLNHDKTAPQKAIPQKTAEKAAAAGQKTTSSASGKTSAKTYKWQKLGSRTGFTSHDGKVHCVTEASGKVMCGINGEPGFNTPTQAADCDADLMPYVHAAPHKKPRFMCLSDAWTPVAASHTALAKNSTVMLPGGTTCTVKNNTVNCVFAGKKSFSLSVNAYSLE